MQAGWELRSPGEREPRHETRELPDSQPHDSVDDPAGGRYGRSVGGTRLLQAGPQADVPEGEERPEDGTGCCGGDRRNCSRKRTYPHAARWGPSATRGAPSSRSTCLPTRGLPEGRGSSQRGVGLAFSQISYFFREVMINTFRTN